MTFKSFLIRLFPSLAKFFKETTPATAPAQPQPATQPVPTPVEPPKAPTSPAPEVPATPVATTPKHSVTTFYEVPTAQYLGHVRPVAMQDPIFDAIEEKWYERADCIFVAVTPEPAPVVPPGGDVSDDGVRNLDLYAPGQYHRFNAKYPGEERVFTFTAKKPSCTFQWGDTTGGYTGGMAKGISGDITGTGVSIKFPTGSPSGSIGYIFVVGQVYAARVKLVEGGAYTVQVSAN
jgi:hypothetical protein